MARHNIKASVSGRILTLTINLDHPNIAPTEKGNKLKVANCFWNDEIPNLPEGYSMSMILLRPLDGKKAKKVVEADEADEAPAPKASKKNNSKVAAKPTKKVTKKEVAKPGKKSKSQANNREDGDDVDNFVAPTGKRRAAA